MANPTAGTDHESNGDRTGGAVVRDVKVRETTLQMFYGVLSQKYPQKVNSGSGGAPTGIRLCLVWLFIG